MMWAKSNLTRVAVFWVVITVAVSQVEAQSTKSKKKAAATPAVPATPVTPTVPSVLEPVTQPLTGTTSQLAQAVTYYVRKSGSDQSSGLSLTSAFRSLRKALLVAPSGSTIYVGAGVYEDDVQILGAKNPSLPLYVIADTTGAKTGDSGVVEFAGTTFRVAGSNNVILEGLTFRGGSQFPLVWENSYQGLLRNCRFLGGAKAVLVKDGSLTLEGCAFSGFREDAILVDGEAEVALHRCDLGNAARHAIHVRKNALITIDRSTIRDNLGNGVQVDVTDDQVELPGLSLASCECTGTSPRSLQQQAYNLLGTILPQYVGYQQLVAQARTQLQQSLASSLWNDDFHAKISAGPQIYDYAQQALERLQAVYTNDVEFVIKGNAVTVNHPYELEVTVLGAAIKSGSKDLPVTVRVTAGSKTYEPWGSFSSPTGGNVNDAKNPRTFKSPETLDGSASFSVSGRSWLPISGYSGKLDQHWSQHLTVTSTSQSSNLKVLRDGDKVPNLAGYGGQASAATFLAPCINQSGKIKLADNQVIFLFELGTTNVNSSAADFQDLVVLASLRKSIGNTTITAQQAATVKQAMDLILQANQALAECAINEAACSGGLAQHLASAQTALEQGVALQVGTQVVSAVSSFKQAWQHAKTSVGNVDLNLGQLVRTDLLPAPPAGWRRITQPELRVSDSSLIGNRIGLSVDGAVRVRLDRSDLSNNREWGAALQGTLALQDCTFSGNGQGGVWLIDVTTPDLSARNLTLANNSEYGLYVDGGSLTFNRSNYPEWKISGSQYVIAGIDSRLALDGVTISGGTLAGVLSSGGFLEARGATFASNGWGLCTEDNDVRLQGCSFTSNEHGLHAEQCAVVSIDNCNFAANQVGLYLDQNRSVAVRSSELRDQAAWGAVVLAHSGSDASLLFDACTVRNNTAGISVRNAAEGGLTLTGTVIRDNAQEGLRLENCRLTLTNADASGWQLLNNGYGIVGQNSALVFRQFTSSSNTCGALLTACDARLEQSTFSGSSVGLSVINPSAFLATDSHFTGNQLIGVSLTGSGTFQNCSVENNTYGIVFSSATITDASLKQTRIADNSAAGLYLCSSALNLSNQVTENWTISGNGTNILAHQSSVSLNEATLAGSTGYGLFAQDSQVTLNASRITAAQGHGISGQGNQSLTISRSHIHVNSGSGWGLLNHSGPLEIHNSVITAASGVYSQAVGQQAHIRNTTIANASAYGIYVEDGEATIQNTILVGQGSGYGLSQGAGGVITHSHNIVHGFGTNFVNTAAHETELLTSPRFVDPANGDFRLAKGSPAINSGINLDGAHHSDMDGNQRPAFKVFDIGAYEFTNSAGSLRVLDWREQR